MTDVVVGSGALLARLFKGPSNPFRISAAIEHAIYDRPTFQHLIIDRVQKTRCEHSMIAELDAVNTSMLFEGIHISKQAGEEITSDTFLLTIVELTTSNQIFEGRIKNSD